MSKVASVEPVCKFMALTEMCHIVLGTLSLLTAIIRSRYWGLELMGTTVVYGAAAAKYLSLVTMFCVHVEVQELCSLGFCQKPAFVSSQKWHILPERHK
jgi:presenilin-like A22 family membrane protease